MMGCAMRGVLLTQAARLEDKPNWQPKQPTLSDAQTHDTAAIQQIASPLKAMNLQYLANVFRLQLGQLGLLMASLNGSS